MSRVLITCLALVLVAAGLPTAAHGQLIRRSRPDPRPAGQPNVPPQIIDESGFEELDRSVVPLANFIQCLAKHVETDSVSVGDFHAPPSFQSAAGTGLRFRLTNELQDQGVRVQAGAPLGVRGTLSIPRQNPESIEVSVQFVDELGNVMAIPEEARRKAGSFANFRLPFNNRLKEDAYHFQLEKAISAVQLAGANVAIKLEGQFQPAGRGPAGPPRPQLPVVLEALRQQSASVDQADTVRLDADRRFGVSLLSENTTLPIRLQEGSPFVSLPEQAPFQVKLWNNSRERFAVILTLDGINCFAMCTDKKDTPLGKEPYTRWILDAGESKVIKGWVRTLQESDEFVLTDFANTPAAKFGSGAECGTITAVFLRARKDRQEVQAAGPAGPGIGAGRRIREQVQQFQELLVYDPPSAAITIRYRK